MQMFLGKKTRGSSITKKAMSFMLILVMIFSVFISTPLPSYAYTAEDADVLITDMETVWQDYHVRWLDV